MLCHPEGRSREQVGFAFWLDAAAQLKNSFHVLLHKVRKGIGLNDLIVLHGDRYRINPELDIWFDAAVFERQVMPRCAIVRSAQNLSKRCSLSTAAICWTAKSWVTCTWSRATGCADCTGTG